MFKDQKKLLMLLVILLSVPVAVFLVQQAVKFFSKAAIAPVDIYFTPSQSEVPPGSVFTLRLNPHNQPIDAVAVEVNFEKDKILFVGYQSGEISPLKNEIIKTGGDKANQDGKIVIVLGPMVNDSGLSLSKEQNNISFLKNPGNIAEIMASTHIGISNGGTSLMEFTMLGVPTIIFPQSEREETFISPFLERRCGILGSIERHEFIKQFNQLWEDITLRKSMSETGRKLIDGLGAIRIAEAIESFSRRIMNNESFGY